MERNTSGYRLAGYALLVATTLRIASIFLWPPDSDASHAKMLATAGAHPGLWDAATLVEPAAWLLATPAVFACVGLVRGRGRVLTTLGGWVWGVSTLALGFVAAALNGVTAVLATEPQPALMVKVVDDLKAAPVLIPFVVLILLGLPGLVLFTVGLARARLFGWWLPAVAGIAVVAYLVSEDFSNHLVVLASFLPLAAVWLAQARLLIGAPHAVQVAVSRPAVADA